MQADFHRGLAYFYTGRYLPAEDAFAFVSTRLPLPEVVNNQGVAAARRGKDGAPLFQQAITGDTKDPDYHFNLALAYARRGDAANAQKEAAEALTLKPGDTEIQTFIGNLHNAGFLPAPGSMTSETVATSNLPLERIKRTYDEAAFRQAAFELEQMQTLRAATEAPPDGARRCKQVIGFDPKSSEAYAGLARIRERTGDRAEAMILANRSIQLHDNVAAHLVLARLALLANQVTVAATEVVAALHIDSNNAEARGLRLAVTARGGVVP